MELRLSITIPAFNEEETLAEVVREALRSGARLDVPFEVLVVNDGSVDGTGTVADRLAAEDERVRVLHHPTNRGFSGAMMSCMSNAEGEFVFLGPADGQATYDDLDHFWQLAAESELVFSYRVGRGDSILRKIGSALWYAALKLMFGHPIPEFSSTFLFRRETVQALSIDVRPDASNFLPVLYVKALAAGKRVATLGTVQSERRAGEAKGSSIRNTLRTLREDISLWRELRRESPPSLPRARHPDLDRGEG